MAGSFPPGAVRSAANWASMPLVFGILAFVYSGHGVFPSVRASMKQPEDFPKVSFHRPRGPAEHTMHNCNAELNHACLQCTKSVYNCSRLLEDSMRLFACAECASETPAIVMRMHIYVRCLWLLRRF